MKKKKPDTILIEPWPDGTGIQLTLADGRTVGVSVREESIDPKHLIRLTGKLVASNLLEALREADCVEALFSGRDGESVEVSSRTKDAIRVIGEYHFALKYIEEEPLKGLAHAFRAIIGVNHQRFKNWPEFARIGHKIYTANENRRAKKVSRATMQGGAVAIAQRLCAKRSKPYASLRQLAIDVHKELKPKRAPRTIEDYLAGAFPNLKQRHPSQ